MSINLSVGFKIPTNVVEVGTEITADQLAAITSSTTPSAANPFLTLAGGTLTGAVYVPQINNILNTDLVIDSYNDTGAGTHYLHKFTPNDGKFNLATNGGGLVFPDGTTQTVAGYPNTNPNGYITTANGGQPALRSVVQGSASINETDNYYIYDLDYGTGSGTLTIDAESTNNPAIGTIVYIRTGNSGTCYINASGMISVNNTSGSQVLPANKLITLMKYDTEKWAMSH